MLPKQLRSYELPKDTSTEGLRLNAIEFLKRGVAARFDQALEESRKHHRDHDPFELHPDPIRLNEVEQELEVKTHREALKEPFLRLGLSDETAAQIVDAMVLNQEEKVP